MHSADYAVARCLSVRPSLFVRLSDTRQYSVYNGYTQRYSYDLSRKRCVLRCLYEFSFFLVCYVFFLSGIDYCYGRPLSVSGRPCYILPMFF